MFRADLHVEVVAEGRAEQEVVDAVPPDVVERVLDVELADEPGLDVELPPAEAQQPESPPELQPDPPVPRIRDPRIGEAEERNAELRTPGIGDVPGVKVGRREKRERRLGDGKSTDQQQASPEESRESVIPDANSRTPSRTGP
jgi:hypothetical protein